MLLKLLAILIVSAIASAFSPKSAQIFKLSSGYPKTSTALNANILETAEKSGNFKTLLAALKATGLDKTVKESPLLTVFAPTDAAFAKLPTGLVDALLKDVPRLTKLMQFHVHPGKMSPTRTGRTLDTLLMGGDNFPKQLTIKVTNWECVSYIFGNQEEPAEVVLIDVKCDNGLIHVIDKVLQPYEGNNPPKVTFIGPGGITQEARLQMDYYGSEAGKGRNPVGTDDIDRDAYKNMQDAWYAAGWYNF